MNTQDFTNYPGIDYGLGRTNIGAGGIRYGVIPADAVGSAWYDSAEADYGEPTCPKCGNTAKTARGAYPRYEHCRHSCAHDYVCHSCRYVFSSEAAFSDTPDSFTLDDGEYMAKQSGDDCDIFVLSSPFFTYAQFCSPCAPGGCYLLKPLRSEPFSVTDNDVAKGNNIHPETGKPVPAGEYTANIYPNNRAFCFGHDWFESGVAPYPVFSVQTGGLVNPEQKNPKPSEL